MKRILALLAMVVSLAACHTKSSDAHVHNTNTVDSNTVVEEPTAAAKTLQKDGKWNADAATNKNVSQLQATAAKLNEQPRQKAEDYHAVSAALQTGLNQLIKECKMKGADHDALHLWLEPVLSETKELKGVTDTVTGERLFHSIRTRLLDYNLYFN